MVEIRGNRNLTNPKENNVNVGVEQNGVTLHFGPKNNINGWETAHFTVNL